MIISIVILVFISLIVFGGYYFSNKVIKPKTNDYEFTRKKALEACEFDVEKFSKWSSEEVYIDSEFGYKLHGFFYRLDGSKKTVVICHGITWSLWGSIKYAALFREMGFNTFVYDHRNHGKSGGKNTTFGYLEKYDLCSCIDWVKQKIGNDSIIGTHGESLGAATVLQNLSVCEKVDFCIADCSFSNLRELLVLRMREDFHLPPFPIIFISDFFIRMRAKFSIGMISPIDAIKKTSVPILFIHGSEDKYIPPQMSTEMYDMKEKGFKELFLAPNSGHAQSIIRNPEEYGRKIESFLKLIKL